MDKGKIEADKKEFTAHVERMCKINDQRKCKICLDCPFKKYVQIMKENNWKLPKSCKIEASKEEITGQVRGFCRSNIRKALQICRACLLKKHIFQIIIENGWKLPKNYKKTFNLK